MSEVPEGRCGYAWPDDVPDDKQPPELLTDHESCCWRETLPDTDKCAWHADPEETEHKTVEQLQQVRVPSKVREQTKPAGELLDGAKLSGLDLAGSISFSHTTFRNSDLSETGLKEADLSEADLTNADLPGVTAQETVFTNADLRKAVFHQSDTARDTCAEISPANLEDAVLEHADLRGADLRDTRLYQTDLTEARVNATTQFDTERTIYERDLGKELSLSRWDEILDSRFEAGAWVHRRLERLLENNAMSQRARKHHIRKQEAERAHHRRSGHPLRQLLYGVNSALTNHGESLLRIGGWSLGVIIVSSLLYPLTGGIGVDPINGDENVLTFANVDSLPEAVSVWGRGLYFSVITFSTIGYGQHFPVDTWARVVVALESLAGALLIALFIFVLGRRTAR